jgi:hypothetical protein
MITYHYIRAVKAVILAGKRIFELQGNIQLLYKKAVSVIKIFVVKMNAVGPEVIGFVAEPVKKVIEAEYEKGFKSLVAADLFFKSCDGAHFWNGALCVIGVDGVNTD